jgi:hypothetical protein
MYQKASVNKLHIQVHTNSYPHVKRNYTYYSKSLLGNINFIIIRTTVNHKYSEISSNKGYKEICPSEVL